MNDIRKDFSKTAKSAARTAQDLTRDLQRTAKSAAKTAQDLTKDLSATAKTAQKTKQDLTKDLSKTAEDLRRNAQDAAYIAVGLGVIGFQRAQVRRHELTEFFEKATKSGRDLPADTRNDLAKAIRDLDEAVGQIISALDARFEPVEQRLPAPAQNVVKQAKDARDQLRSRIVTVAA
jgi:uncharacterized phage infection (PIP) family protein YhgE